MGLSCQVLNKNSKKGLSQREAGKGFTKAMWVYLDRSFKNGKEDMPRLMDKWADAGFTLLIPEIRRGDAKTHYSRTKHEVSDYAKGWDPLEVFNLEAKKRGMKVHPWCHVFRGVQSKFAQEHPEFIGITKDGKSDGGFLCSARDEVHDWTFKFYEELMNNYDVAGVHLDYIRYRSGMCWCDYCKGIFKRETGVEMADMKEGSPAWSRWITQRVYHINRFVKRLQDRAIEKDMETSAAVYAAYPDCIPDVGQDWLTWVHGGLVDLILPMNYWGNEEKFNRFADIHISAVNNKLPVFEGFSNHNPGKPFEVDLTPEGLFQRSKNIKYKGFQGVCYFSSSSLSDKDLNQIKKL
jgi:uncharacterized lipoprotein YddW (UPF0748 family)